MADIDEWQTEMQLKPMRVGGIQLFTCGLNDEERKITGVDQISSVTEAVSLSMEEQKSEEVAVDSRRTLSGSLHGTAFPGSEERGVQVAESTRRAAQAAPYPLSMLQTTIPGAQEDKQAASAVSPSRLAP